jgi:ABC-type dipeptide/oligopeptide/nickel transport system permease component
MSMYGYLLRRLLGTIPVMLVVALFIFLMLRLTPSDPAAIIAGDNASAEQVTRIRGQLGLDRPMVEQFFIWSGKVLSGDFGESFFFKKTVASLIGERIEPTLSLAFFTILIAVFVAVPLGVLAAHRHGSWIDRIVMGFSVLGFSVPVFVIGYLLIYLFSIWLNWLPVQGYQRISEGVGGWVQRLILPSVTLSVIYIALIARMTRTSVLEVLSEDYIRTARAKGQIERKVLFRHALRNAAVPIVTVIGLGVALLIGGVVVTESVFTDSGPGPAYRRCSAGTRLSDDPGRDPPVLVRLCYDQPGGRHDLYAARSKDPLLMADVIVDIPIAAAPVKPAAAFRKLLHNPGVVFGGVIIAIVVLMGLLAPWLGTIDPTAINPIARNRIPGAEFSMRTDTGERIKMIALFGTDGLGRDIYSRVVYGARVSLLVGVSVALISVAVGLFIGLLAGFIRILDAVIMRIMDGLMAIPAILLAIAMVSLFRSSVLTVIIAITVPQIPGVVRLVRAIVLSVREEPYVEAAVTLGTSTPKLLWRHVLPNTIAPVIVQGTFICASAILVEAILSFLGIGVPPEVPTWGNIMAEGRQVFSLFPHNIIYPGVFLAVTILAVNVLGDGLRDAIDPKMAKRV